QYVNGGEVRAEYAGGYIVGHDHIEILSGHLVARMVQHTLSLGSEADQNLVRGLRFPEEREDVVGGDEFYGGLCGGLLQLLRSVVCRAVIGDGGRLDQNIHGRGESQDRVAHFRGGSYGNQMHAGRWRQSRRTGYKKDFSAALPRVSGNCV